MRGDRFGAALVAAAAMVMLASAACSNATGTAQTGFTQGTAAPTPSPARSGTVVPRAPFAGPGDFYDVPDPLPPGAPGELIRFVRVDTPAVSDRVLWRVMYHSRDAQDRDVAVTGSISVPVGAAPERGWSTLAWGHGTGGMAPRCAGSRSQTSVPGFGTTGIIAASDYAGLGPNGHREAYLSRESEGHSVIDSVRAAHQIPGVVASNEWTAVGISEGGFAVLSAAELAPGYAPELSLLGTVAMAPGTELDRTFPGDNPLVVAVVKAMGVYGIAVDHPEVHPEQYASPALQAASAKFDELCVDGIAGALATIPPDAFWTVDPFSTDVGKEVAAKNNPGNVVTKSPLLIVQGDADIVVVPARTQAFYERICEAGQVVSLVKIPGANHDLKSDQADAAIADWLEARLAHQPAASTCP